MQRDRYYWRDQRQLGGHWFVTLFCRLLAIGVIAGGCSSRPSRIRAIAVDPAELSSQVVELCDADGSGALSETELLTFPPVYASRTDYDTDGNGEVSADELEARFTEVFDPQVGLLPASCRVTRNGRPVKGAQVRFFPPKPLEELLPPASGVTDESGTTRLRLAPEDLPANFPNAQAAVMRPGLYLVEVTHPEQQIPSQYNTQTTLGKEVFSRILNGPPLRIDLKY